ncbi:FAD-dependent oxidoreductase [Amycolatopsis jejuensis]|uniref:FAD-dependent oxidoreductase n=1 Tax=Amycolatopsis jejuensis TaxID=330084 RepID=UPI00068E0E56|nr:FAD-dependent oxidoreductase [Amycolatopsis jejuensis]
MTARPVVAVHEIGDWDESADVVVVGSGAAALVAGVMAADGGARVIALEKAAETGGTTRKSGGNAWVPDDHRTHPLGLADTRESALHYLARTSRPQSYSPHSPFLGLPEWEYDGICLFLGEGAAAFADLAEKGALATVPLPDIPNFYSAVDDVVHGRTLAPCTPGGDPGDGPELIRQLTGALEQRGGRIELEHRVVSVVADGERVVGVLAETPRGRRAVHAARAVIFGSGGFTHNADLRRSYLRGPVFGGCAAATNEGDFVAIAQSLGADLRNMAESWNTPIQLERAVAGDPALTGTFSVVGDSVLCVNRYGRRTMNEKTVYNEATGPMLEFDGARCEYPNMLMFAIFDQANYDGFRGTPFDGGALPAIGDDDSHVIRGDTLEQLAGRIDERLARLATATGGLRLDAGFTGQLAATVERFNGFARQGRDDDFRRGETEVERYLYRLVANAITLGTDAQLGSGATNQAASFGPGKAGWVEPAVTGNPTMAPLAADGPYYSVILAAGMLDTKGGPRVDAHSRVLTVGGNPIPGLYAVGNCAASPSGKAYWGGGGTLGPIITYAWRAGKHAATASPVASA